MQAKPGKPIKGNLPTKCCVTCGRPFAWRKKWTHCWDEVRHCSDRCHSHKNRSANQKRSLSS